MRARAIWATQKAEQYQRCAGFFRTPQNRRKTGAEKPAQNRRKTGARNDLFMP